MIDIQKYWDDKLRGKVDGTQFTITDRGDYDEINMLVEWIKMISAGKKEFIILDVGPCTGVIYSYLRKCLPELNLSPDNYKMVEISSVAAEYCHKFTGNRPFVTDSPDLLPMATNSVDLVMCQSVLMHTPADHVQKLFGEMVRVSREWIYFGEYIGGKDNLKPLNYRHEYSSLVKYNHLTLKAAFQGKLKTRGCFLCKKTAREDVIKLNTTPLPCAKKNEKPDRRSARKRT